MDQSAPLPHEQRKQPRCYGAFPVRVRGQDSGGEQFEQISLADNVSSGGFYAQLPRQLRAGSWLFASVRLPDGPVISARGTVLRIEERRSGLYGLAVKFANAQLLPASAI